MVNLFFRVVPPVGGPDAMEFPSQAFQDGLAELVSISGCFGLLIGGSITLNAEKVTPFFSGMDHSEVDPITRAADLMMNLKTLLPDALGDKKLKIPSHCGYC